MALERLEQGNARTIAWLLPPVTVEISLELLREASIEGLLKKSVDVHGVLSEILELQAKHLEELPSMPLSTASFVYRFKSSETTTFISG